MQHFEEYILNDFRVLAFRETTFPRDALNTFCLVSFTFKSKIVSLNREYSLCSFVFQSMSLNREKRFFRGVFLNPWYLAKKQRLRENDA